MAAKLRLVWPVRNSDEAGGTDRKPELVDRLEADRRYLGSFVQKANAGIAFDDLDDALKKWWLNRY